MKKYFVLALALIAFAVAPVMAEVAISGEYDFSAAWNTGDKEYASATDKMEFDVKAVMDDFNTFKFELEESGLDVAKKTSVLDEPLTINYVEVITDWGKYFGTMDKGFGIVSKVGLNDYGYKENVEFTGYALEESDKAFLGKGDAIALDFDIMGIVKPYYAMHFDTYGAGTTNSSNGAKWIMGAVATFEPVLVEAYFMSAGDLTTVATTPKQELNKLFGVEVLYSGEVADGVELTSGAYVNMTYTKYDEYDTTWGAAVGASAYGGTVNLSMKGSFIGSDANKANKDNAAIGEELSYALSMFGIDGEYAVLEWLDLNAGMLFAMGDYAKYETGDETFLGMEFGVAVKPGKGIYRLGYIVANEDAQDAYAPIYADAVPANPDSTALEPLGTKGGLYFKVEVNY